MKLLRIIGVFQILSGVLAIGGSFTGVVFTPPMIAGKILWPIYLAFQVLSILAGVVLLRRVRLGVALSLLVQVSQLFRVQWVGYNFVLSSALSLYISLSSGPGTVLDPQPPTQVVALNLLALAATVYLLYYQARHLLAVPPRELQI